MIGENELRVSGGVGSLLDRFCASAGADGGDGDTGQRLSGTILNGYVVGPFHIVAVGVSAVSCLPDVVYRRAAFIGVVQKNHPVRVLAAVAVPDAVIGEEKLRIR